MNKETTMTDAVNKRAEQLARLKELHYRRVCIESDLFLSLNDLLLHFRMKLES